MKGVWADAAARLRSGPFDWLEAAPANPPTTLRLHVDFLDKVSIALMTTQTVVEDGVEREEPVHEEIDLTDEQATGPDVDGVVAFHAHLDVCERCRTRPFDLCEVGRLLLARAGKGASS